MPRALFSYLVCEVIAPGQLLPCPKEAVADPICCAVLLCNVTKFLKEAVADPTWVQSTIATIH